MADKADTLTFTRQEAPAAIPASSPAALYVHIPFCRHLCPFCPYNKIAYDPDLVPRYIRALRAEIRRCGETCGRLHAGSLYFGGGTPTTVLDELEGVMDDLNGSFAMNGQSAIETTPAGLTPDIATKIRHLGFNAVSLGVQSYHDRFLRQIGRPYDGAAAERASAIVTDCGFETVNFDLMFALPGQSTDDLRHDLLESIRHGPDQITCYPLFTFPYATVGRWRARNRVVIPNRRLRWRMYRLLCEMLADHGYARASVWSFVRANVKPFSSVTRDRYLGFGAGAASYNGRTFTFNTFSVPAFIAALDDGRYPTAIGMPVSPTLERMFWLYWRLYETRIPKAGYRNLFGRDPSRDFAGVFRLLRTFGFVADESADWLTLNSRGCHWVHLAQNLLALNDVNTVWSAARATAYPERIRL